MLQQVLHLQIQAKDSEAELISEKGVRKGPRQPYVSNEDGLTYIARSAAPAGGG